MLEVPRQLLNSFYNRSSLRNDENGIFFALRNRLKPTTITGLARIAVDGEAVDPAEVFVSFDNGPELCAADWPGTGGTDVPLGTLLTFRLQLPPLADAIHSVEIALRTASTGVLEIAIRDRPRPEGRSASAVPRDHDDDYSDSVIGSRRKFIRERIGVDLKHVAACSFDPHVTRGNIEHFTGVAQVPLGFAGPLLMKGEHASGEFYVPLATTEGTLVASYNRGMKVIHRSGGVRCSVVEDHMQRAPVFAFDSAADAHRFRAWVEQSEEDLRRIAEATDRFVRLRTVECYQASCFAFLRFNFRTGDAAGQNMVGKATFAACNWILQACDVAEIRHFYLEANLATDKKPSVMNMLRTRGKRVIAEATIRNDDLREVMNVDAETLHRFSGVASVGAMLSGANNNGCHSVNAITAIFLATGQDVANVAEASAAILYTEITPEKDLYVSLTLPSLIVATCGGGTGLPTQRECLETLDCYGAGKVLKFAEIVAATALAGELSLGAAIVSLDWVAGHEQMGRNAPEDGLEG